MTALVAYLRVRQGGECASLSIDSARQGFASLGVECRFFREIREIPPKPEHMVIGFVGEVQRQLARLGVAAPDIDYPPQLAKWLGRAVCETTLDMAEAYLHEHPAGRYFLKPVRDKMFDAVLLEDYRDLRRFRHLPGDTPVWICPWTALGTEYRCYILRDGAPRCLGVLRYRGQGGPSPNDAEIEEMIHQYSDAPAAYALDIAVEASDSRLRLVEINDGYAVQNYGLAPRDYAVWLAARWAELAGAEPHCVREMWENAIE